MSEYSHRDSCPECLYRGNFPLTTEPVSHGVQCTYKCANCDGEWTTSWFDYSDREG